MSGANEGLIKSNLKVLYTKKVLNQVESEKEWWNGLYIVVVEKE